MFFFSPSTTEKSIFTFAKPRSKDEIFAAKRSKNSERVFKIDRSGLDSNLSWNKCRLLHVGRVWQEWFERDFCAFVPFSFAELVSSWNPAVVCSECPQKCRSKIGKSLPADAEQPESAHRRSHLRPHAQQ